MREGRAGGGSPSEAGGRLGWLAAWGELRRMRTARLAAQAHASTMQYGTAQPLLASSGNSFRWMSPLLVWMTAPRGSSTAEARQHRRHGLDMHQGVGVAAEAVHENGRQAGRQQGQQGSAHGRAEGPTAPLPPSTAAAASPTGRSLKTSRFCSVRVWGQRWQGCRVILECGWDTSVSATLLSAAAASASCCTPPSLPPLSPAPRPPTRPARAG